MKNIKLYLAKQMQFMGSNLNRMAAHWSRKQQICFLIAIALFFVSLGSMAILHSFSYRWRAPETGRIRFIPVQSAPVARDTLKLNQVLLRKLDSLILHSSGATKDSLLQLHQQIQSLQ